MSSMWRFRSVGMRLRCAVGVQGSVAGPGSRSLQHTTVIQRAPSASAISSISLQLKTGEPEFSATARRGFFWKKQQDTEETVENENEEVVEEDPEVEKVAEADAEELKGITEAADSGVENEIDAEDERREAARQAEVARRRQRLQEEEEWTPEKLAEERRRQVEEAKRKRREELEQAPPGPRFAEDGRRLWSLSKRGPTPTKWSEVTQWTFDELFEELDTALGDVFNKGKPLYLPNKGRLLRLIFLTETAEQLEQVAKLLEKNAVFPRPASADLSNQFVYKAIRMRLPKVAYAALMSDCRLFPSKKAWRSLIEKLFDAGEPQMAIVAFRECSRQYPNRPSAPLLLTYVNGLTRVQEAKPTGGDEEEGTDASPFNVTYLEKARTVVLENNEALAEKNDMFKCWAAMLRGSAVIDAPTVKEEALNQLRDVDNLSGFCKTAVSGFVYAGEPTLAAERLIGQKVENSYRQGVVQYHITLTEKIVKRIEGISSAQAEKLWEYTRSFTDEMRSKGVEVEQPVDQDA